MPTSSQRGRTWSDRQDPGCGPYCGRYEGQGSCPHQSVLGKTFELVTSLVLMLQLVNPVPLILLLRTSHFSQIQTMGGYPLEDTTEEMYTIGMTNPFLTLLNLASLVGLLLLSATHSYYQRRFPPHHQRAEDVGKSMCTMVS